MNNKSRVLKAAVLIFCVILLSLPCVTTVMAADLTVSSNKELTAKFNKYDKVTVSKGKTLTLAKRSGEPVGLEVAKSLVVEEGAKITGDGIIILHQGATYSGITLYYKFEGNVYPIPSAASLKNITNNASDYNPTFTFDSKNDRYILEGEFKGGDPFEVDFTNREITLIKGKKQQLDLSGVTEGVEWSSSDKSVATISKTGMLTAKGYGKAVISATYHGKTKTCNIEVVKKGLSTNTVYIDPGKKMYIQLNGTKVKSVSSSNKKVATISKKLLIKGVKDGQCKVTVTGTNGKKYTCTVVVGNGGNNNNPTEGNNNNNNNGNNNNGSNNSNEIKIIQNTVKYTTAEKTSGSLESGATVSNTLSGFKAANGKTGMNHPNGIATDGTHFVVCDTWNNRVLIYNSLPTGGEEPDVVLGQKDFKSFDAGYGETQMNWPVGAAFAGGKLFITDTNNYRVLVYNSVPAKNGAKPDSIIERVDETHSAAWPWAIWSDGTKLILTSTLDGRVAIWNNADDAAAGKYADIVLEGMGTPRTIISDGNYLLIGDHNVLIDGRNTQGSYVWKTFPKSNASKPDFVIASQYSGTIIDGNLYVRDASSNYYVYDGLIDSAKEKYVEEISLLNICRAGDYNDLIYVDGKTYASCYNSSYIAIYNGKVTSKNVAEPDGYLGNAKKADSANLVYGLYQNPIAATDGTSLVIADDYNRMLAVYKTIPDSDNVRADIEYMFESALEYPIDVDIAEDGRMFVLTPYSVLVWNKVPVNGEKYDARYEFGENYDIGKNYSKLAVDGKHVYISSEVDNRIYEFKLNAKSFRLDSAVRSIEYTRARNLYSNGEYLVVTNQDDNKIDVYRISDFSVLGTVKSDSFDRQVVRISRPADAIILPDGRFAVANTDQNTVLIYENVNAAIENSSNYSSKLGDNGTYQVKHYNSSSDPMLAVTPVATKNSLFMPSNLLYRDGHLWVGEFKFSSRLIRYDEK